MYLITFFRLTIDSIKSSESELAKSNIYVLKELINNISFVVIFEREYP